MADRGDEYTADEVDAITFGADASASWDLDSGSSSANDLFLMSANLRGAAAGGDLHQLHADLFKGYQLQPLQTNQRATHAQPTNTQTRASAPDDLASLLSKFESSSAASALQSGAPLSALNEFEEFDSRALRMVDDLADDEEEVAAATSATSAWGAPTSLTGFAYASGSTAVAQSSSALHTAIPPPGTSPAPLPQPTAQQPKGVLSIADLERQLKGQATGSPSLQPQAAPGGGLPQALQQLALAGQTGTPLPPGAGQQQQAQSGYTGPPLPQFQHGSPAPPGLSVDEHDRQHFYIPLPRSQGSLGFMTKSEIALVFRIQLSQLQSIGDPLADDFYYQVMQARKGGKINSSGQAILPVFKSNQPRNEDGSPKLPEGTLGRISAFSVHKPKKLMAISDASGAAEEPLADDQPRKTNMFAARTLNYLIEEAYRAAMDLEDVDALLASLAPQRFEDPARAYDRQRLVAQRAELATRLLESLDLDEIHLRMAEVSSGEHLIFKFYAVPKGRLLLYRSLVLLNPPNTYQLVDVLMHDLAQIAMPAVPAPSTDEKLIFLMSDLIYSMPLLPYANEIFSYFLTPKHAPRLVELVRTQMMCQFLQVLFKKGHEANMVLQQNPHVPSVPGVPGIRETVQQWRGIFDAITHAIRGRVAEIFDGLPKDKKPTLPPTASQLAARQRREKEEKKAAAAAAAAASADKKPAAAAASSVPAGGEEKDAPKAPSYLSTRFGMWELFAAFFSHASGEQHAWLDGELRAVLLREVEELYGEYRERKAKQQEAIKEKEKEDAAAADKKDDAPAGAASATPAKAAEEKKDDSAAGASKDGRERRAPHSVPPASSLPPPPSPALRFLSSALLGEQSAEFQSISRTWHELHGDYSYYQLKHQQKVAQEQARLAQQQQMRAQRQGQQRQQWQQYHQGQQRGGGVGASPNRVPPQHAHFHTSSSPYQNRQGQHQQHQQRYPPRPHSQQQHQQPAQQQPPPPEQPSGPPKPVPVWVKPGQSGAAALKTPVKEARAPSPAK